MGCPRKLIYILLYTTAFNALDYIPGDTSFCWLIFQYKLPKYGKIAPL